MPFSKVYVLSENPDREVEQTIHEMTEAELRVALYGIARGWKFDEAITIAVDARKNKRDISETDVMLGMDADD